MEWSNKDEHEVEGKRERAFILATSTFLVVVTAKNDEFDG
jgi:hypothetical protein